MVPTIAHAQCEPSPHDLPIWVVDFSDGEPTDLTAIADDLPAAVDLVSLKGMPEISAIWLPPSRTLEYYHGDIASGVIVTSRRHQIPAWELAAPIRRIIHWHCLHTHRLIVHGATLSVDGCGVLFVGRSGSGKSTLTAMALADGLSSTGDDMILVDAAPARPMAHALYDCLKLDAVSRAAMPNSDALGWRDIENRVGKKHCPISTLGPNALASALALDMILLPSGAGGPTSEIVRTSPIDALRAMAQPTVQIFRGGEQITLSKMAALTRRLPCYRFSLGADLAESLEVLRKFCKAQRPCAPQ